MTLPGWGQRWATICNKITLYGAQEDVSQHFLRMTTANAPHVLAFVNAHAMNCVVSMDGFYTSLLEADTVFRDGSGMAMLLRRVGKDPGLNLNGTDLIPRLIARYNQLPIALYGTQEPYLSQARSKILQSLAPESEIFMCDGFRDIAHYLELARVQKPKLIVLGMGMPKQEAVAQALKQQLSGDCLIVCGGAIIDFLGDKVQRAPVVFQKTGLEWLFRLLSEPRRLFKRYVIGNPMFLLKTLRFKAQG